MTEFSVTFTVKPLEVSADTPAAAVIKAAELLAADLSRNVTGVGVVKRDRITVTGLKNQ